MRKFFIIGIVIALLLAFMAGVSAAPAPHKVTGGGTTEYSNGQMKCILAVSAMQIDEQNTASGMITAVHRYTEGGAVYNSLQAEVRCLVVDGNKAWIAGEVVRSDLEDPIAGSVGDGILIWVEDGSPDTILWATSSSPDQMIQQAKDKIEPPYMFDLQGNMRLV